MQFLKLKDLKLNEGGYLVNAENGEPVTNTEFVAEQVKAHYVVTLASKCAGKVFKAEAVASFAKIAAETMSEVKAASTTTYFEKEAEPKSKVLDELIKTALAFHTVGGKNERVEKLNRMLQEYNNINKVENFGMYFTQGVVELCKLYSIADVKKAFEVIVDIE